MLPGSFSDEATDGHRGAFQPRRCAFPSRLSRYTLSEARTMSQANEGQPARVFRDFEWSTKESWSRRRRVIGKAEWTGGPRPILVFS